MPTSFSSDRRSGRKVPTVGSVLLWNEKAWAVVHPFLIEGHIVPAHVVFVPGCPTGRTEDQLPSRKYPVAHRTDNLVFDAFLIVGGVPDAAVRVHLAPYVGILQSSAQFAAASPV